MLFNWKSKILSPIVAIAMLFTMCPSTTFAKLTWLHEILEDRNHVPSVEDIKHIVSIHPEWLNEKDDDGHTPLDIAKANGLSEIVSFLSKSASSGDDQLSDFFTSFTYVPDKIAALEAQTEELTIQMTEVTKETAKTAPQVVELSKKIAAMEPQIEESKQKQLAADERIKKVEETAKSVPTVVETALKPQIEELKRKQLAADERTKKIEEKATEIEKSVPTVVETALKPQIEELKRQIKSLQTETTALRSQLAAVPKAATILSSAYPVGSIYMSINSTDPSTLFGGKWVRWGNGRVPVGIDSADTTFSTPEKTGGEKAHTLTVGEMPTHAHKWSETNPTIAVGANIGTEHGMSNCTYGSGDLHFWHLGTETETTGGNGAHNNLQPYITCYMWKRIA